MVPADRAILICATLQTLAAYPAQVETIVTEFKFTPEPLSAEVVLMQKGLPLPLTRVKPLGQVTLDPPPEAVVQDGLAPAPPVVKT